MFNRWWCLVAALSCLPAFPAYASGPSITAGKPYVLSPAPASNYPDSGGELTNGVTATGESWVNAAGWLYVNPTITLDLGQAYNLTGVQLYVGNSHNNGSYGVARPVSVAVSVSSDGVSFTTVGALGFVDFSDFGTKNQIDRGSASVNATARWVRFMITAGGPWVMVTELGVTGSGQPPTSCVRSGRSGLSDVAADALSRIETNLAALSDSPVPASRLLSTCNRFVSVQIDGPAIFTAARDMIALADHEVDIAFYVWEPNSQAARLIGDGLILAQTRRTAADPLLVRIIVDDVDNWLDPGRKINGLYDSQKNWVSRGLDLSRVRLQLATSSRPDWLSAPLHDKLIVVDARQLLVTGANVELVHDAGSPWHDSGYVLEGDIAQSALAAFEQSWTNSDAYHWECNEDTLSRDCDKLPDHYPTPVRNWLPPFGSQRLGDIPVLAVGRAKGGTFDDDTNNPQDIAWLTLMDRASSFIHIETPNINDNAFQEAVAHAVARGVTVRLITSLGFNDLAEDLPSLGGDNLEVAGRLRQAIRARAPWYQDRFQLRWYSKDGVDPVKGNGSFASHTKYMTTDNRLAMVGSGNQDTASWNISHELNLLIDDPPVTAHLESSLFLPDWSRAAGSYVELYEGNGGTQDVVCPIFVTRNKSLRFFDPLTGTDYPCDNDEARSILLHDVPAGKVLRFYDDPDGRFQDDDWTEIITKRAVARKYVDTFEQSFEDADVKVIFHRDNGLDGKISFAEVAATPVGAVVDLYEGNHGSQSLVCSNRIVGTRTIYLTSDAHCNNDEARSLVLYDFPPDKAIFLYDDPGGSRGDDWAIIIPKRLIARATVGTFESSFETADFKICSFPNNGLDGKVSRIRIGSLSEAAGLCSIGGIVSAGKPYVLSPTPASNYPDSGGELTNSVKTTGESWVNAAGWLYVNPMVTLDLGQIYNLTEVQLYVGNSHGNGSYGVYQPASTAVSVSSDGVSFTPVGNLSFSAWSDIGTKNQVDRGVAAVSARGRWVRFSIVAGGPWVMITEMAASGYP